jgi:peptidoglycan pentaglycine glycine transferase (the first glycine)
MYNKKSGETFMKLTSISDATAERWNSFVAQWPDFELMQSYQWGTFKEALGWKVVRLAVEQDGQLVAGAQMLVKPLPLGLASIAYIPRGPLLHWEDEAVVQTLLSALHASARRHRAISLKIEPAVRYSPEVQQRLQSYGFRRSPFNNNQPQCSMLIDLTPDTDTILANMHKTTRYNIRYSARRGVVVREGSAADLDTWYRMLEFTAKRVGKQAGFSIRSREYYQQEWNALAPHGYFKFFLATYEDEVLAARMPAAFGNKAATFHSGSFDAHRKLKPNELLMWESIKWAKAQGCTTYDVWGIPDEIGAHLHLGQPLPEEQTGGLWGVYHFKRGFGGDVVYYVGAYDFVYSSPLDWLMNTAMTRLGSLEKLAQLGDRLNL